MVLLGDLSLVLVGIIWMFLLFTGGDGSSRSFSISMPRFLKHPVKVITDIDDTVVSSGGHRLFGRKLAGIDTQFKRGEFYPGVTQFVLELAHASRIDFGGFNRRSVPSSCDLSDPSKLCVLTARPKELKFALALKPTCKVAKAFETCGTACGKTSWGMGDVHYGSLMEVIRSSRRGWRKFNTFEQMVAADEQKGDSRQYVFIGDTGDRDEDAAERMAAKYPHKLRAVFLHAVYPAPTVATPGGQGGAMVGTAAAAGPNGGAREGAVRPNSGNGAGHISSPALASVGKNDQHVWSRQGNATVPADRCVNGVPVYYFRTYIGAAAKAYNANLLSAAAVRRVALQAARDMRQHEETHYLQYNQLQKRMEPLKVKVQGGGKQPQQWTPRHWWPRQLVDRTVTSSADTKPAAADAQCPSTAAAAAALTKAGTSADPKLGQLIQNMRSKWEDLRRDATLCAELLNSQFLR